MADYTLSYTGQEIDNLLKKIEGLEDILPIEKGGTGATTVADALKHLCGIYEDEEYAGCYYRMDGNVKEWLNPPMESGVKYRTTKRHMGGIVYVQSGDIPTLASGSSSSPANRTIAFGESGDVIDTFVHMNLSLVNDAGKKASVPYFSPSTGELLSMWNMTGSRTIMIKSFTDLSNWSGQYYVEYTLK